MLFLQTQVRTKPREGRHVENDYLLFLVPSTSRCTAIRRSRGAAGKISRKQKHEAWGNRAGKDKLRFLKEEIWENLQPMYSIR